MSLPDDVKLLTSLGESAPGTEAIAAAEKVMNFLDGLIAEAAIMKRVPLDLKFPRGYYADITGLGCLQLCTPQTVSSNDEAYCIFARDVAAGFLEELANSLGGEIGQRVRDELGL